MKDDLRRLKELPDSRGARILPDQIMRWRTVRIRRPIQCNEGLPRKPVKKKLCCRTQPVVSGIQFSEDIVRHDRTGSVGRMRRTIAKAQWITLCPCLTKVGIEDRCYQWKRPQTSNQDTPPS